jgi:Na+-transporting methylmalonyl-CoA/oxaloacetate decarboxylase gamma subunit
MQMMLVWGLGWLLLLLLLLVVVVAAARKLKSPRW